MVYADRLQTNLLRAFRMVSTIFVTICEVNIVAEQKKA